MTKFDFWFEILVKTSWWWNCIFWMAYIHNTQAWVEWNIFLWIGLSNLNVFVISSLMYILHIWSMFGIFMAVIHESLMRISCVFIWIIEGERPCSFQVFVFIKSCIEVEFCWCHSWSYILYFLYFSKFWSWVFLCWWHLYSYSPYV